MGTPFGFPVVDESIEIEIIQPAGNIAIADLRMVETEWDGQAAKLISLRDVTERKNAEEALRESEKNRMIFDTMKKLLVTLSHHINNATAVIAGNAEISLGQELNAVCERAFNDILRQAKRITTVIDALNKMAEGVDAQTTDYASIDGGMYDIDEELQRIVNETKSR